MPDMPLFDNSIAVRSGYVRAIGDLCGNPLRGRTVLTAHSGRTFHQPACFWRAAARGTAESTLGRPASRASYRDAIR
jgi:hypothetical protein